VDKAAAGPRWLLDERVAQCVAEALQYGARGLGLYELIAWVLDDVLVRSFRCDAAERELFVLKIAEPVPRYTVMGV
jgi:hypothetical protein